MCCWTRDRAAARKDNNGNCGKGGTGNDCTLADPADNSEVCLPSAPPRLSPLPLACVLLCLPF